MKTAVLAVFLLFLSVDSAYSAERIAVIVDTSRSMNENDIPRYAAQIAKILSDLVDDDDSLMLIRMPTEQRAMVGRRPANPLEALLGVLSNGGAAEDCSPSPAPDLTIQFKGSDRNGFKSGLDRLLNNDTGTLFAIPIATAEEFLAQSGARMLLILADSGGFVTNCTAQLNAQLARMRRSGVYVGLVNLGSSAGSFSGSQAFDLALGAGSSQALVGAVARIYQQFLGSKKVQTGPVGGPIRVKVDPYVSEAFLVVAAEGAVAPLQSASGNPGAESIDSNFRGGGTTVGLDRQSRGYRIVKLTNPDSGEWEFSGASSRGGWMLIQESSIAVRAVAGQQVAANSVSRVDLEVFDKRNGKRITDPAALAALKVSVSAGGQPAALRNNGDGTLSFDHRFPNAGSHTIAARVTSDVFDREVPVTVTAIAGGWNLTSLSPETATAGQPVLLRVKMDPIGRGGVPEPDRILARASSGETVELQKKPDGTFSAEWNPSREGPQTIRLEPIGGQNVAPIEIAVNVSPRPLVPADPPRSPDPAKSTTPGPLSTPPDNRPPEPTRPPASPPAPRPQPISFRDVGGRLLDFGRLKSGSEATGLLELEGIPPQGQGEIIVSTDLPKRGITLEIEGSGGWVPVGTAPAVVALRDSKWKLRLRVGSCPAACSAADQYHLNVSVRNSGGLSDTVGVPVRLDVQQDPWLNCNWPYLAGLAAALLVGFIAYGFYSPFRFPRRAGVQLSPELDLSEGFFYALRGQPGAKSGFYRNARLFVSDDFRISGKNSGAFARLRAGSNSKVYIMPHAGREVWRQRIDGEWERLPDSETVAAVGTPFRNDQGSVFFDLRIR